MLLTKDNVIYKEIPDPHYELPKTEPALSDEIYQNRLKKILAAMKDRQYDYLIFYADREHYNNFDYVTGFGPRFEEGILILSKTGELEILLGNECFGMYRHSRIPGKGVLCQALSLPNQPMDQYQSLEQIFKEAGIMKNHKVGLVGWKLMNPVWGNKEATDVPEFLASAAKLTAGAVSNATDLFIHPEYGVRVINTAEEIASFEFGAAYASDSVQKILANLRTGLTEVEISNFAGCGFLPISCFPKVLAGDRMDLGMVSPTTNPLRFGDRFQVSLGLRGGLTNRRGLAVYGKQDLEPKAKNYLEDVVAPYFAVVANWYEQIGIGVTGGEIYSMVQKIFPKETYGWVLNPGHLIATEEWMSSPIYEDSQITLKSGMCLQMDIIPTAERCYAAPNCEDGVVIADKSLRQELQEKYPEAYARMAARRRFMQEQMNIHLKPEILPLSNLTGLYRPYMLNKEKALAIQR